MCGRVLFVVMLSVVTSYFVVVVVRCCDMVRTVVAGCDGRCCDDEHCGLVVVVVCALELFGFVCSVPITLLSFDAW